MMVFTTLFIAVTILAGMYFLLIRLIPWAWLSYILVVGVGIACLIPGDVHFRYVGIEILGFGWLLVWLHHKFFKPKQEAKRKANSASQVDL